MAVRARYRRVATGAAAALVLLGLSACGGGADPAGQGAAGADRPTRPGGSGTSASPSAAAAPAETPAPGDHRLTLTWAGKQRTYALHAPPGWRAGTPLPLVVVLHWSGGDAATVRQMTGFDARADRDGFLVAYPDGISHNFNALICCGDNDDVGFVKALVEHLRGGWGADPARTYAAGISNGAELAYRMAVEAPGLFAAVGAVSGAFLGSKANSDPAYRPAQPTPVVTLLGNDDTNLRQLWAGLGAWQRKLGCTPGPQTWADAGKTVERTVAPCGDGSEVQAYVVHGMGHGWPGGAAVGLGDPRPPINATDTLWAFFTAHPRRS